METNKKATQVFNKLSNLLFFLSILFFTIGLNFQDTPPPSGWYQQFIPNVNNMPISDIEFLDSLTGFAVTGDNVGNDTNYILKTTNGGDNWFINFSARRVFFRVIFINSYTGYVSGGYYAPGVLYKTTNQGSNWLQIPTGFGSAYKDMSILNEDTIWVVDDNSFDGGVFRTTNGGQNWTQQYFHTSNTANHIYMIDGNTGFVSTALNLLKTTNSGINWNIIPSENGFLDMYFIDSLIGWKTKGDLEKTTDGGLVWIKQQLPSDPHFFTGGEGKILKFSFINSDTIWGVEDSYRFGPGNYRGIIWKCTNGGENWGYQIPDTNIHIVKYFHIDFTDNLNGSAYHLNTGVHTITGGGDTTIYVGVNPVSNKRPINYKLFQNYPNPFNPTTKIRFELPKSSFVKLIVYDILGKEIATLVNERLSSEGYEVDWTATGYTSGVYFYRLITMPDGRQAKEFSETKKMLLVK